MESEVLLALIASMQTVATLYIKSEIKKNACGGAACVKKITEVLNGKHS